MALTCVSNTSTNGNYWKRGLRVDDDGGVQLICQNARLLTQEYTLSSRNIQTFLWRIHPSDTGTARNKEGQVRSNKGIMEITQVPSHEDLLRHTATSMQNVPYLPWPSNFVQYY